MRILYFLLLFSSLFNSQIIKDSILGKPKFVKEYVVFLNNSGPFTFMSGDNEYGHAVMMIPKFLRERMNKTWFESNFCRYTNNETHYDKDRKIIKETWYYKSGRIVDDYHYEYDILGRLKRETSKNDYSENTKLYFYDGKSKIARFEKNTYKSKNDPKEFYLRDNKEFSHLLVSKFDSISKTDSIFSITNKYMKNVGERTYTSANDTIYNKRLSRVKKYDSLFRVINEKVFNPDEYNIKKVFLEKNLFYEYDTDGKILKINDIKDGKFHYYYMYGNGKIVHEEKPNEYGKNILTIYAYHKNGFIESRTHIYGGSLSNQIRFEYKNNLIEKLIYLDTWGKKEKDLKPNIIIFKYKFDKHKNWTECIKNVDGKDLYMWKREIKYYK